MVTDEQVKRMREMRSKGVTQEIAAARAGMSERTARKWQIGLLPSGTKVPRKWRTREDPLEKHWATEVVPLLEADRHRKLQAKTILGVLEERHLGEYGRRHLRTLHRRVRDWRALHGPNREVFFEQEHKPGHEAGADFTHGTGLEVTICSELLRHLFFTLRLSFSGRTYIELEVSETFEALVHGIQQGFAELGGTTEVMRHDNLSAATHELRKTGGRCLNKRFADFMAYMEVTSTRSNVSCPNENGGAEKGNDLVKQAINQELIVRGSRDFDSVEEYLAFARAAVDKHINRAAEAAYEVEYPTLRPLPQHHYPEHTTHKTTVRVWSTFRVGGRSYSVPSRLIGHALMVRQYRDRLEVFYRDKLVETIPRLHGEKAAHIDYRHIIWSLVRKPGAFAGYRYREELFPSETFRRAYDAQHAWRGEKGDLEYLRILHLAASTMEATVETALSLLLEAGAPFDHLDVQALATPDCRAVPSLPKLEPDLGVYDRMIGGAR